MLATIGGFLLFLWAFAAAICALYTPLAFRVLDLDPFALHVVTGTISISDLASYQRFGMVFSQGEIRHFSDVAQAVAAARMGLIGLLAGMVGLIFLRPGLRARLTSRALALYGGCGAVIGLGYAFAGYETTSDFLHGFVFEPGTHVFSASSLTGHLYNDADMIAGACLVFGLAALALVLAWCTAHMVLPWPCRPASGPTTSPANRKENA